MKALTILIKRVLQKLQVIRLSFSKWLITNIKFVNLSNKRISKVVSTEGIKIFQFEFILTPRLLNYSKVKDG